MKYLKITIALFALTFIFAGTSANAEVIYNIQSITIPAYKINWKSPQQSKYNTWVEQTAKKTHCTDDITLDGRVILGRAMQMLTGGYTTTDWLELPPQQEVGLGEKSKQVGGYKLYLQSNKWLMTTATFSGVWVID